MPGNRAEEPEATGEKRSIRRRRINPSPSAVDAVVAVNRHPYANSLGLMRRCYALAIGTARNHRGDGQVGGDIAKSAEHIGEQFNREQQR